MMKIIFLSLIPYLIFAQSQLMLLMDDACYDADAQAEYNRVVGAGDTALSLPFMSELITEIKAQGLYANLEFAGTTLSGYEHTIGVADSIGTLYDISGNENDLITTYASSIQRPFYVNLGTYPAVSLAVGIPSGLKFTSDIVLTNFTVVLLYGEYTADITAADYIVGGTNQGILQGGSAVGGYAVFDGALRDANEKPAGYNIFRFQNAHLYKDGAEATYTTTGTPTGLTLKTFGFRTDTPNLEANGYVLGLLIFNAQITTTQADAIEAIIHSYYLGVF